MTVPPAPDALAEFDATVNGYPTRLQLSYLDATVRGLYTSPAVALPWGTPIPRAGVHQASVWDDYLKTQEAVTLAAYSGAISDCAAAIAAAIVALKATPEGTPLSYTTLDNAVAALTGATVALDAAV